MTARRIAAAAAVVAASLLASVTGWSSVADAGTKPPACLYGAQPKAHHHRLLWAYWVTYTCEGRPL